MFITDGVPSDENETQEVILSYLNENNQEHNISLFSYALGGDDVNATDPVNTSLLKSISCKMNGIMFDIAEEKRKGK